MHRSRQFWRSFSRQAQEPATRGGRSLFHSEEDRVRLAAGEGERTVLLRVNALEEIEPCKYSLI